MLRCRFDDHQHERKVVLFSQIKRFKFCNVLEGVHTCPEGNQIRGHAGVQFLTELSPRMFPRDDYMFHRKWSKRIGKRKLLTYFYFSRQTDREKGKEVKLIGIVFVSTRRLFNCHSPSED